MSNFVHLHVHTQYSLLDGAAEIGSLVKTARDLEMPALAITDHGVMYGCLKFYQQACKAGIKPLLGCEMYVAPRRLTDKVPKLDENPFHLVLLAENNEGYHNLLKLVSLAHTEGFYYKPRIDLEQLRKHTTGLIALSGCMSGVISRFILNDQLKEAKTTISNYQEVFGKDNFFLEIQYQQLAQQRNLNRVIARLGAECDAPLVATNDVHYLKREDAVVHDVLLCIQTGKTVEETNRLKFSTPEFYLKTAAEMQESFFDYPQAIANTLKIAERCEVRLETGKIHMPQFEVPASLTPVDYLEKLCQEAAAVKVAVWSDTYQQRLGYELSIIQQMGFSEYFLIVRDFVNFARTNGIMVGPGRGSAAGSLVAFLLGITSLDPLEHGLLFERFLNPQRISMPDIDIDFCYERRGEVIQYVRQRFGTDRVAQIITFGTMAARAAIRDVGRVLGLPYGEVDRVAKLIPHELGISLVEAIEQSTELKELVAANARIAHLISIAVKLEGFPRHASTHAAGVVIAAKPLTEYLPLARSNEGEVVTQFTMEDIESIGLLKMDFLGLRTLTVLRDAMALVEQHRGIRVEHDRIPLDDALSFTQLQEGNTLGVFQLESSGIRRLLVRLKPQRLADLTALMALYRPGPLGSGMVDDFIKRRHGEIGITYLHPLLESILQETQGVILYQEQVMQIASRIGGFSLAEADLVRRAMGKKKPEVLAGLRTQFVAGAVAQGITTEVAAAIFDLMEYFSGYGFNKSHSAAYALVVYQTAYFKTNYPQEYMSALLTSVMGNPEKIGLYIEECRRMKLKILHPDVNHSQASFVPEGNSIRFGMVGIKNVGLGAIEKIIAEREVAPFQSLADFCRRIGGQLVNKRVIDSLIRAGAFDFCGLGRNRLIKGLDQILEHTATKSSARNQLSLLSWDETLPAAETDQLPDVPELAARELLELEKEYLGVYLSGHPLDGWSQKFRLNGIKPIGELEAEFDGKEVMLGGIVTGWKTITTKAGATMASFRLEDLTGTIETIVFPRIYQEIAPGYQPERIVLVKGRFELQDQGAKILAAQIRWL